MSEVTSNEAGNGKSKNRRRNRRRVRREEGCFNCHQQGHFARDCPLPKAGPSQAPGHSRQPQPEDTTQRTQGETRKRKKRQKQNHEGAIGGGVQAMQVQTPQPPRMPRLTGQEGKGLPPRENRTTSTTTSALTTTRFDSFPLLESTKRALATTFGYELCTVIQAQAIPKALSTFTTHDLIAKAKTGTGKTLAFLIPALEVVARRPARGIAVLCISPTRELAQQIAAEAKSLGVSVDTALGGTNVNAESKRLCKRPPTVLVATPGRLLDHLSNGQLRPHIQQLRVFILDEADILLDMGFRRELEPIIAQIPPASARYGMLFSATFQENVQQLAALALRPQHHFIDTVGSATATANRVQQFMCFVDTRQMASTMLALLEDERRRHPDSCKAMVFFTTAQLTKYYSQLFITAGVPVLEMHSRITQSRRTRVAQQFRDAPSAIMFTSDVSARGMDYPNVGLVVQVGLPSDRKQYIHRVGRTARADATGRALLLAGLFEQRCLQKELKGLPVQVLPPSDFLGAPAQAQSLQQRVDRAANSLSQDVRTRAYQAFLGFYNSNLRRLGWSKDQLITAANAFARDQLLCREIPALRASTIGKMGLREYRKRTRGEADKWDGLRVQ